MGVTFPPPGTLQLLLFALWEFAPLSPIPRMQLRGQAMSTQWAVSRSHATSTGRCWALPVGPSSEQTHTMAKGWIASAEWLKSCWCGICKPQRRVGSSLGSQVGMVVGKKGAIGLEEGYLISSACPSVLTHLRLGQCRDRVRPT